MTDKPAVYRDDVLAVVDSLMEQALEYGNDEAYAALEEARIDIAVMTALPTLQPGAGDLLSPLQQIARGRSDCGRPMASEVARQLARSTLIQMGLSWPRQERPTTPHREEEA